MTFDDALHAQCEKCHRMMVHHRLDADDRSYCLEYNEDGRKKRSVMADMGFPWQDTMVYRVGVEWLNRSSFPRRVGKVVNLGLGVHV